MITTLSIAIKNTFKYLISLKLTLKNMISTLKITIKLIFKYLISLKIT